MIAVFCCHSHYFHISGTGSEKLGERIIFGWLSCTTLGSSQPFEPLWISRRWEQEWDNIHSSHLPKECLETFVETRVCALSLWSSCFGLCLERCEEQGRTYPELGANSHKKSKRFSSEAAPSAFLLVWVPHKHGHRLSPASLGGRRSPVLAWSCLEGED